MIIYYKSFIKYITSIVFNKRIPLSVHFSLTNRCPLNCIYCGFFKRYRDQLNTDEVKSIISQLKDAGNIRLHLTGGEPMLRNDIGEIVKYAKSKKLFVTIATSGYKVKDKWEEIKDIDIVFLSFDGPPEVHESQRGAGSFKYYEEARDFLVKNNARFYTTTVITAKNKNHLDYIIKEAAKYNSVANFFFLYIDTSGGDIKKSMHREKVESSLYLSHEEKREIVKYLLKMKKSKYGKYIGSSISYFKYLLKWDNLNVIYRKEPFKFKCKAGKLFAYIDSNGDLYACGEIMGQVKGINLLKIPLKKALYQLPPLPCYSCIVGCYTELNLMFNLNLESIFNWILRTS